MGAEGPDGESVVELFRSTIFVAEGSTLGRLLIHLRNRKSNFHSSASPASALVENGRLIRALVAHPPSPS